MNFGYSGPGPSYNDNMFGWLGAGIDMLNMGIQYANAEEDREQSERNIRLQAQMNRELAEYQFDRNLEMWNLNNKYNSASEQMKRMKSAGLNPAVMYGNISPGNSGSPVTYQEAPVSKPDIPGRKLPLFDLSNLAMFQELEKKSAEIDTQKSLAGYYDAKRIESLMNVDTVPGLRTAQIGNYQASASNHSSQSDLRRFILSRDKEFLELERDIKVYTIKALQGDITVKHTQTLVNDALKNYYQSMADKNKGILPYIVGQEREKLEQSQYITKRLMPMLYALRDAELEQKVTQNLISKESYQYQVDKLYYEARQAGVDMEIAREYLDNLREFGYPYDPVSAGMSSILQTLVQFIEMRAKMANNPKGGKKK